MSKGNHKKGNPGLTPKELELYYRARREKNALSFAKGFPAVVELPASYIPRYMNPQKNHSGEQGGPYPPTVRHDMIELENGSLLDPVSDLLHMVEALDLYAARCSDDLSRVEHCREDCTHELESKNLNGEEPLDDQRVLAIGKKLQLISEERRDVKNRFEIVKLIKRAFESKSGQDALQFLAAVLTDENRLRREQSARRYTPRTDILDDLYGYPLPKYVPAAPEVPVPADTDDMDELGSEYEPCPLEVLERLIADMPDYLTVEPFIDEPIELEERR